jgi:hypothetical protein
VLEEGGGEVEGLAEVDVGGGEVAEELLLLGAADLGGEGVLAAGDVGADAAVGRRAARRRC